MMQTTINDDSLKNNLIASSVVHLALLLLLYFGLPHLMPPLPSHHDPVPFEIVEIADLTNTRVKEPEPQTKPPEPPPPKPETKPQQAQSQPTPPQPPQPVEALNPAKPLPKPPPPKPVQKPNDAFAKMLKNLETNKQQAQKADETKPDSKSTTQQQQSQAPSLSTRLTISQEDALRRQISQCWNMPVGARDAQNLVVEVVITVNQDRTVQHAEIVDKSRMATDSFFRAAAEAALRAVYNPQCSPLELPADKYDQWKTIDFTFDPRDML